jgi:EmrB/QacA subfamily drug resistance transporter
MQYRQKVAVVYLLGFFVDLVNMFITNVAYPDIAHTFHASVTELAWVSTIYILGLTIVIPISHWLATLYGDKRVFIFSLLVFLLASLFAAMASSLPTLLFWRFLQGMGGGLLIPLGQAMTYRLFPPHERPALSTWIMGVGLLAPALSPTLGGLVVDAWGWRWIFFINIPMAALTLLLAIAWLKDEKNQDTPTKLDLLGLVLGSLALALILIGLSGLSLPSYELISAGVLLLGLLAAVLYLRSAQHMPHPILNLSLIRDPLLKVSMQVYLLVAGVFMGISLINILYLQEVLGMSATRTGLLMLPWALASLAAIVLSGRSYKRLGPRPLFIGGALLQGLGLCTLLLVSQASQQSTLVLAYVLMGFGGSLCSSTAQSTAFLRIPQSQLGAASAIWNIGRQISFCLGVSLLSVLLNLLLTTYGIPELGQPESRMQSIEVFHLCYIVAAIISTLFPLLLCARIQNTAVLQLFKH